MQFDAFPFSQSHWDEVNEASLALVNASLADDDALRQSLFIELTIVLHRLRTIYGDHPTLIETEADFSDDPAERRLLYEQAIAVAVEHSLPTYTIRISLAKLLLDDFLDPTTASAQLAACEHELSQFADESERCEWNQLVEGIGLN